MFLLAQPTPATPTGYSTVDWVVLGAVAFGLSYLILRTSAKRRRDPLENASSRFSLAQQRSTERQMESLLVELSEMARQISSQLDTRAAKLETLLREADQKLEQLRAATVGQRSPRPSAPAPKPPPPRRPEPTRDADDRPPMRLVVPETTAEPRHAEVYRLADEGQSAQQIAQRLNRPSGEIELILALRR